MASGNDNRINLRPYILIFCFFWGLVLGFSAYLYMKTAAQRLEIIEVEEEKANERKKDEIAQEKSKIEQIDPFKKAEEVEKPPEVSTVLAKPEVKLIDDKIITPDFRQPPVIPSPKIEDLPGLTGATVRIPVKPEPPAAEVVNNSAQELPVKQTVVRKKNPFADESEMFDNVAPPELDD